MAAAPLLDPVLSRIDTDLEAATARLLDLMRIPSISSPNIMALGEVLRVREGDKGGVALEFRSISELHSQAILRYAIRRERQLARNQLFSSLNL